MPTKKRRRRKKHLDQLLIGLILIISVAFILIFRQIEPNSTQPDLPTTSNGNSSSAEGNSPTADASNQNDTSKIDKTQWNLTLASPDHPLPKNFTVETAELYNGLLFDARAAAALDQMISDGNEQGLSLMVCSAYRTMDKQITLFNEEVEKQKNVNDLPEDEAIQTAKTIVAYPGTSEHNLGLAADIVATHHQTLDEEFAQTDEAIWLKEHCAEYGFILRYPKGKEDITKIIFEPWHFRYVGTEVAKEIMEKGITLEEYLGETA